MTREEKVQKLVEKTLKHIEEFKNNKWNKEQLSQFNKASIINSFMVLAVEDYCKSGHAFIETYPNGIYILDDIDIDILLNDRTDVLDRVLFYLADKNDYNVLHFIGNSINDYFIRDQIRVIEKSIWERQHEDK
jgi:hypothetical protein